MTNQAKRARPNSSESVKWSFARFVLSTPKSVPAGIRVHFSLCSNSSELFGLTLIINIKKNLLAQK